MVTHDSKLESLLDSKERILKLIKRVESRMKQRKDNEEVWPGNDNTRYHDDLSDYEVLKAHLTDIEEEIKKLTRA